MDIIAYTDASVSISNTVPAATPSMPPQILEIVLRQVNSLLTDVNEKLETERELLSQIDYGTQNAKVKEKRTDKLVLTSPESVKEEVNVTTNKPPNPELEALNVLFELPNTPELESDPFGDKILKTTTMTTKTENPLDNTPEKKAMLSFMEKIHVSYFYGSIVSLINMIQEAPDDLLLKLIGGFEKTISRMVKANELKCLGDSLRSRLQLFAIAAYFTPLSTIRDNAVELSFSFGTKDPNAMFPGTMKLILKYDSFFNSEEGNELLDSVVMAHKFCKEEGDYSNLPKDDEEKISELATSLAVKFINATLAPTNRLCDSYELKTVIAETNQVYSSCFPDAARTSDNTMKFNKRSEIRSPSNQLRRTLEMDSESKFIEIVHAFILKYQDLFNEFVKEH